MMKNKNIILPMLASLLLVFFTSALLARGPVKYNPQFHKTQADKVTRTLSNVSNWAYWIVYDGLSAHDPINDDSGGVYPRQTTTVIFTDGLVWGGYVGGINHGNLEENLRVGGVTYAVGTVPGYVHSDGTPAPISDDKVRMYRIHRDFTKYWDNMSADEKAKAMSELKADAAEHNAVDVSDVTEAMMKDIVDAYAWSWENWPADLGAPVYPDGTPGLADADQVIWFAVNDFDPASTNQLYGSQPIGLEVATTIWAYNQPSATLGQLIFKKYRIINYSGTTIDSMFVSQWSDPDVGNYSDDLTGCDVDRSLMIGYSGFLTDDQFSAFNLPPGCVGYDFFQGPIVPSPGDTAVFNLQYLPGYKNLPMTSYGFFSAGADISDPPLGDPAGTLQWYNMMNGYTPTEDLTNPTPYKHGAGPLRGQPTKFPLDGDPFLQVGDIDATGDNFPPGDRRMFMCSGPFTMQPGDTQEVTVAVIGGIIQQAGGNNRNAVAQLKINDDFAQFIYKKLFEGIPKPPSPAPSTNVTVLENEIVLDWGSQPSIYNETEKNDPILGFNFEGYNVYQLPNAQSTKEQAKLVATFDINNFITIIRAKKFLPEFGDVVTVPVQKGSDNGIQRYFVVKKDYINDTPLYPGSTYYFAVTAYNYNPDPTVPEPSLETSLKPIEIVPQPPKPGESFSNAPEEDVSLTKVGPSTGSATVTIVDPAKLVGHDYEITFSPEEQYSLDPILDSLGNVVGYDTIGIWHKWNLLDATTSELLLENLDNFSGDKTNPLVDGMLIQVSGSKFCGYSDWSYEGNRWISGVNWGGAGLFGGLDIGAKFFGSTLALCDLVPVRLEFQDKADVDANGYISKGAVYRRDQGYAFWGIGELPFAAYDVSDPANPRRLNISFVESDGQDGAPANGIWDMGWNGTEFPGDLGAREYIFIHASDYNGGIDYNDTNWAPSADVLYAIWPTKRGSRGYLLAKFTLNIIAEIPFGPSDSFTFSTKGYVEYNKNLAKEAAKKINVFPNPYYAFNPQETGRFDRFVTFNHLPKKAKIRIFNLAGTMIRTLDKDDSDQFLKWDLKNEAGLPVASGLYIAHVDLPDLGMTRVLKVFIVQSQQIIEYY